MMNRSPAKEDFLPSFAVKHPRPFIKSPSLHHSPLRLKHSLSIMYEQDQTKPVGGFLAQSKISQDFIKNAVKKIASRQ